MLLKNYRPLIVAGLLAASTTMTAQAADVKLKIGGTLPIEHFGHEVLVNMAAEIEAADVGIEVKYFPAGQLGSGEELFEDAKNGNVDIVHATIYAQADKRLEIASLPFLVTTVDELRATFGDPTSEYNNIIREVLADHNIEYLANIGEGLIGVIATQKPADVAGFGNQEMNIRVWSSKVAKATMETLGYQTTTMSWAEVFPAVQAGTIDGAICCTPEWAYTTFAKSDVGSVFVPYNAFVESTQIYANKSKWGKLNDEQRAVVQAAASKASTTIIDQAWDRTEGFLAQLEEKNWEIVEFSQEERDAIKAKVVAEVWPTVGEIVGQDLLDRLNAK